MNKIKIYKYKNIIIIYKMNTTKKTKLKTIYESFVDTYKNNKKELKELSDEVDDLETKFSND